MTTKTFTIKPNLYLSHKETSTSNTSPELHWNEFSTAVLWVTHQCQFPSSVTFHFRRIQTQTYRQQKQNHIGTTGREVGCVYFCSEHLILYGNNSAMSDASRTASSVPGILLWTVAFTWWELLKDFVRSHQPVSDKAAFINEGSVQEKGCE